MSEKATVRVFDPIIVERDPRAGNLYRARTNVPPAWGHLAGVNGAANEEGPWVEAHNDSLEGALDELFKAIGKLCVRQHGGSAV